MVIKNECTIALRNTKIVLSHMGNRLGKMLFKHIPSVYFVYFFLFASLLLFSTGEHDVLCIYISRLSVSVCIIHQIKVVLTIPLLLTAAVRTLAPSTWLGTIQKHIYISSYHSMCGTWDFMFIFCSGLGLGLLEWIPSKYNSVCCWYYCRCYIVSFLCGSIHELHDCLLYNKPSVIYDGQRQAGESAGEDTVH